MKGSSVTCYGYQLILNGPFDMTVYYQLVSGLITLIQEKGKGNTLYVAQLNYKHNYMFALIRNVSVVGNLWLYINCYENDYVYDIADSKRLIPTAICSDLSNRYFYNISC